MDSLAPFLRENLLKFLFFFSALALTACGGSDSKDNDTQPAPVVEPESITISGVITVEEPLNVDADVALNLTESGLNNSFANAQALDSVAVVGGYLSTNSGIYPSSDPRNQYSYGMDRYDFYRVDLQQGQKIFLDAMAAHEDLTNINIRMRIYSASDIESPEDTLTMYGRKTTLAYIAPATDTYYVVLDTEQTNTSMPLLYSLTISQNVATTSSNLTQSDLSVSADFAPGEVIVQLKGDDGAGVKTGFSSNSSTAGKSVLNQSNVQNYESLGDGIYHLSLDINRDEDRRFGANSSVQTSLREQTISAIEALRQNPSVLYAEPNYIRKAHAVSVNDPRLTSQWNLGMIDAAEAWEDSLGTGVVIAVIDTGIASRHEDLSRNVLKRSTGEISGYDFVSDREFSGDGDGYDSDPEDEGGNFHGSHVAGISSAVTDNGRGIAGVAPESKIMPLRALGVDGFGYDADIIQAFRYAAGLSSTATRTAEKAADIINMSLGGGPPSAAFENAINQAIVKGIIVIASTGNEYSSSPSVFPVGYPGVIGVGAVSLDGNIWQDFDFFTREVFGSNFGQNVDVVAPGGDTGFDADRNGIDDSILSTIQANEYADYVGTSMATPHVSGVAALMKSINPLIDHNVFSAALASGEITDNLGDPYLYGSGLINAEKAVEWAKQQIPDALISSPPAFNFFDENISSILTLRNPGNGDVNVNSVTTNLGELISSGDDWFTVTPEEIGETGLGTYLVEINRGAMRPGIIYSGNIEILYDVNDGEERVDQILINASIDSSSSFPRVGDIFVSISRKANPVELAETGHEYILVDRVKATFESGFYRYESPDLSAGTYKISASTNNDADDDFESDQGEAYGNYPTLGSESTVTVLDSSVQDIDFGVSYRSVLDGEN